MCWRTSERLPTDLKLTLATPLRVKVHGAFIETIDLRAIVQSIGWRLNALAIFHGDVHPFEILTIGGDDVLRFANAPSPGAFRR